MGSGLLYKWTDLREGRAARAPPSSDPGTQNSDTAQHDATPGALSVCFSQWMGVVPAPGPASPGSQPPASPFLPHNLPRCCWLGITGSQNLTLPFPPPYPGAGTLSEAHGRCPVTDFCLLLSGNQIRQTTGCQDRHTQRRNLLSEKLSLNLKYPHFKKEINCSGV